MPQTKETFMGRHKKTTKLIYVEFPAYFDFLWCKKIYALHKIPSY